MLEDVINFIFDKATEEYKFKRLPTNRFEAQSTKEKQ